VAIRVTIEERAVHWFIAHVGLAVLGQPINSDLSVSSFLSYDRKFEFALADGCQYDAHIAGTLTPVFSHRDNGQDVEAALDISANLVCPQMSPVHVEKRLAHTGPLKREQVEALIAQHATITREDTERRCVHVPAIYIRGESIVSTGVDTVCSRSR
jgi:hypothetical protein